MFEKVKKNAPLYTKQLSRKREKVLKNNPKNKHR